MEKKNIFLAFEGVDGVGKTTLAERLASEDGFDYHKGPSGVYARDKRYYDAPDIPTEARLDFYGSSNVYDSKLIGEKLRKKPVVIDRYIGSTYAYHGAMDPILKRKFHPTKEGILVPYPGILVPDITYLITAHTDIRNDRLEKRGEKVTEEKSEFLDEVQNTFPESNPRMITVDNSADDRGEAAIEAVRQSIRELFQTKES